MGTQKDTPETAQGQGGKQERVSRVFRFMAGAGLLLALVFVFVPVVGVASTVLLVCVLFRGLQEKFRRPRAPAWDAESGSPELPWPPPELDHVRRKREAYARRRVLPPWAEASRREFQEAKAVSRG